MRSVRSGRNIDSALRKKGFLRDSDADHVLYYLLHSNGDRTFIKTKNESRHDGKYAQCQTYLRYGKATSPHETTVSELD